MDIESFVKLFGGISTPVLAMIVTYIAWQNYLTASNKLRFDLFEKRYRVYRALMMLLGKIENDFRLSDEDLKKYYQRTRASRFLFGDEVNAYFDTIKMRILELRSAQRFIDSLPDHERSNHIEKKGELLLWFSKQVDEAPQRFDKYLLLGKAG